MQTSYVPNHPNHHTGSRPVATRALTLLSLRATRAFAKA